MKTILYNPIFINPQAYYVFPRLTRYLQPDNESTVEPANYIGTIEVKVIAYGDTTLKRTYSNTDYIDLSEFKNTWIRISLFTKVGSCVLGEWKIGDMQTDLPYIDPEVLASLKAVVIVGNKTNNDSDRAIVKNLVDASNPFVISNAAYEGMSGYNGYPVVFGANKTWEQMPTGTFTWNIDDNKLHITKALIAGNGLLFSYVKLNGSLFNVKEIPSFKIKVSGLEGKSKLWYRYLKTEDAISETIAVLENGTHELPKSYTPSDSLHDGVWVGFTVTPISEGVKEFDCDITIEVLPEYESAFVTDGINDLITSTKTVQEMLGGSNEITVVSMVHQVKDSANNVSFTNYIRGSANGYFRNIVNNYDKTGIYGYTSSDLMGLSVVNNILGDKNDYTSNGDNRDSIINGNFSVQGYSYNDGNNTGDFSSVAWYWTIIANKVLTTDQINQVIAYFNLDRTLKPDILCDVKKQGITNENHTEFNNKLIDFSGNGRDIQLNNIAWKGDSGIGKYEVDFASLNYNNTTSVFTATYKSCSISKIIKDGVGNIFYNWGQTLAAINSTKIQVIGLDEIGAILEFTYLDESGNSTTKQYSTDGIYDLPASAAYQGDSHNTNFRFSIRGYIGDCDITITQIPSHAGALLLDGINDFGKVTGMPIYKDYTIVVNKDRISTDTSCILSKATTGTNVGAFITEFSTATYSFGLQNAFQTQRVGISYQSKYVYNGERELTAGSNVDTDTMWLGTIRDNDSRFFNGAIYSLMSFPYSMSKFLIERQLKKHKLGTLYPDIVEFRPIVKSNNKWDIIEIWQGDKSLYRPAINDNKTGIYLKKDSTIGIYVKPKDADEVTKIVVNGTEYTNLKINSNGFYYVTLPITKSPQKINITIDEYIRYEDIVQPYPVLLRFNDENGNEVSWGGKFRVGSTITRIGSAADSNLLPNIYNIFGLLLNDNQVTSSKATVEKTMVFKAKSAYIFDNNEPKCILSPRLLRIPNSSYKILGYIPDISGHGNHGVIHNSAYAEGSGVNEDGSYQFDGVDDFVTIPTTVGGKQVLMKVNWKSAVGKAILYDQRGYNNEFAIYNGTTDSGGNPIPAYQGRNDGQTYIDGILNKNINASELRAITHNITITNELSLGANKTYPVIGTNKTVNSYYANMALCDFMLFDEISTDDKILELNEYVGIEGNTE